MEPKAKDFKNNIVHQTDIEILNAFIEEIRAAVAFYMISEGCSCCEDRETHKKARKKLAKLLEVEKFDDDSGYDFYKYVPEHWRK